MGAGITGEVANIRPWGIGAGITGEVEATAQLAAANRTEAMKAKRALNVIEVIDPLLPWFELCTKMVP